MTAERLWNARSEAVKKDVYDMLVMGVKAPDIAAAYSVDARRVYTLVYRNKEVFSGRFTARAEGMFSLWRDGVSIEDIAKRYNLRQRNSVYRYIGGMIREEKRGRAKPRTAPTLESIKEALEKVRKIKQQKQK